MTSNEISGVAAQSMETSASFPPNDSAINSFHGFLRLPSRRVELLNWFREKAMPLADAYEGAIRLICDPIFPGRLHFIAHAVRDICDRLVFVLDPQLKGKHVQYANEMDKIEPLWTQLQSVEGSEPLNRSDTVTIKYDVAIRIDALVTAHRERRIRTSNYELLFRYLMRNEPQGADVKKRLVEEFKAIRAWFMDLTHLRSESAPQIEESLLQTKFAAFESMLHSFVGDFFTGTRQLDEILQQANQ